MFCVLQDSQYFHYYSELTEIESVKQSDICEAFINGEFMATSDIIMKTVNRHRPWMEKMLDRLTTNGDDPNIGRILELMWNALFTWPNCQKCQL